MLSRPFCSQIPCRLVYDYHVDSWYRGQICKCSNCSEAYTYVSAVVNGLIQSIVKVNQKRLRSNWITGRAGRAYP